MTNQPFHNRPESSPPDPPRHDVPRGAYNPITLDDVQRPASRLIEALVGPLDTNVTRSLAAFLFVVMFVFSQRSLPAAPILIVLMLSGLLFRMTKRQQLIAGAPLTFAAVRLATMLVERFSWWEPASYSTQTLEHASDLGIPWMPLFFSVCLFYMPVKDSYTSKVVVWDSVLLLLSGLLPGQGYAVIFVLVLYTLFLAIAVALACDLNGVPRLLQSDTAPAAQPQQA
jgi:hypothetical protein